jgi:stress-induced-phosphoprotein 1
MTSPSTADKAMAQEEKDKGNAAYKNKDFATAHQHYDAAIRLDPTNITYYSNKAAALFEENRFDECIELCKKAVDVGRDQRADFKLIAKVLARIGNAYVKLDNLKDAVIWYDKSLSEHRDHDLVKKRQEIDKQLKQRERLAYINPALAQEEKEKGNKLFTEGMSTLVTKLIFTHIY